MIGVEAIRPADRIADRPFHQGAYAHTSHSLLSLGKKATYTQAIPVTEGHEPLICKSARAVWARMRVSIIPACIMCLRDRLIPPAGE
jgi:hypothetical protein